MSDKVGFCIVGLGMGRVRAKTILATPGASLVNVVDLNETRAREAGEEFHCKWTTKLDEALADKDVDVVMVMTPSGLHADVAVQALRAGKHVIVTKPMEVSVEKCDAMIAAARESKRLLGVDFQERYADAGQQIKYALQSGLFGTPILCEARLKWFRNQAYYDAGGWRGTWKMDGGGALANQTIHNIDLLCWFMGRAKRVIGRIDQFTHKIETEDLGMAMIEFESGAVGTVLGTTTFPKNTYWAMEVHGSEGGVLANLGVETKWVFLEGMEEREKQLHRVSEHKNVIEDVVSAVLHGTPLLCDGEQGRLSIELLNAIYTSARNNSQPVTLASR